ncbi:MAG: hypothetical protein KIS66_12125 [Fimbriimonadaceae bacterium]|nr:hypothetical protein [Fimbriimonadaceae bacterium]
MAKISRPVLYTGLFAVAVAAFYLTQPEGGGVGTASRRKPAAKASAKDASGFTEEDRTARGKFVRADGNGKNVFLPIVAKATARSGSGKFVATNGIPPEFAGGETGWSYTGNAEIDGKLYAGLQNSATGETVLLIRGQSWKRSSVSALGESGLTLTSTMGLVRKIDIPEFPSGDAYLASAGGVRPLAVAPPGGLSGPIGGQGGFGQFGQPQGGQPGFGNPNAFSGGTTGFGATSAAPDVAVAPMNGRFGGRTFGGRRGRGG